MSRVSDLRQKIKKERSKSVSEQLVSVQEQLRGDHIETLEVLQTVVDENDALRKTVQTFRKKILSLGGSNADCEIGDPVVEEDTATVDDSDDTSFLIAQIGAKDKELATVKGKLKASAIEIKDLKELVDHLHKRDQIGSTKSKEKSLQDALDEANNRIQRLKDLDAEMQAKKVELNEAVRARDDLQAAQTEFLRQISELSERNYNLEMEISSLHARKSACIADDEGSSIREDLDEALLENNKLAETLQAAQKQVEILIVENHNIKNNMAADVETNDALKKANQKLIAELDSSEAELSKLEDKYDRSVAASGTKIAELNEEIRGLQVEISKLRSKAAESSGAVTSSPFLTVDEWTAVSTKNEDAPSEDFRQGFEEFVRLKKENRTLKIQLTAILQQQSAASSSGASTSGATVVMTQQARKAGISKLATQRR